MAVMLKIDIVNCKKYFFDLRVLYLDIKALKNLL